MFFYGWLMVSAGFLVLRVSWGSQFSFSVFLIPLTEHFGWSRANIAGVFSHNMLLFGAGSIFSGKLTERLGSRTVVGVGEALRWPGSGNSNKGWIISDLVENSDRSFRCPGRESTGQRGNLSFAKLIENAHHLEKERFFFSTKMEMTLKY